LQSLDTLVFLMGVHNVGRISQELIAHGRDPATPAAMIQAAFWPEERVVTGTLASIAADVERAGIEPPATLVVGEVVRLREKLQNLRRNLPPADTRFRGPR
jgi:uroporphyrinogen III methyltransferase/synthase